MSAVGGISRAHAQRLIGDGRALVNGMRRRSSDRLAGGERVTVELTAPPDESLVPESIPLVLAYEDALMLIVDKPAGLVVHPSAGHGSGTLVNALLGRARDRGEPLGSIAGVGRPGIVHRLDKETSGLIVVAKTDAAQASLMRQFGDRSIEKEYLALVRGEPPSSRGRVEAPIGRDPARPAADGGRRRGPRIDHGVRGCSAPAAATRCSPSIRSPGARTRSAPTCPT